MFSHMTKTIIDDGNKHTETDTGPVQVKILGTYKFYFGLLLKQFYLSTFVLSISTGVNLCSVPVLKYTFEVQVNLLYTSNF